MDFAFNESADYFLSFNVPQPQSQHNGSHDSTIVPHPHQDFTFASQTCTTSASATEMSSGLTATYAGTEDSASMRVSIPMPPNRYMAESDNGFSGDLFHGTNHAHGIANASNSWPTAYYNNFLPMPSSAPATYDGRVEVFALGDGRHRQVPCDLRVDPPDQVLLVRPEELPGHAHQSECLSPCSGGGATLSPLPSENGSRRTSFSGSSFHRASIFPFEPSLPSISLPASCISEGIGQPNKGANAISFLPPSHHDSSSSSSPSFPHQRAQERPVPTIEASPSLAGQKQPRLAPLKKSKASGNGGSRRPASRAPEAAMHVRDGFLSSAASSTTRSQQNGSVPKQLIPPTPKKPIEESHRLFCKLCRADFRGQPELDRHLTHSHEATTVWMCFNDPKQPRYYLPNGCKPCDSNKTYARGDNAASHMRRVHCNPKDPTKGNQHRGGKSGGGDPPLVVLKDDGVVFEIEKEEATRRNWLACSPTTAEDAESANGNMSPPTTASTSNVNGADPVSTSSWSLAGNADLQDIDFGENLDLVGLDRDADYTKYFRTRCSFSDSSPHTRKTIPAKRAGSPLEAEQNTHDRGPNFKTARVARVPQNDQVDYNDQLWSNGPAETLRYAT